MISTLRKNTSLLNAGLYGAALTLLVSGCATDALDDADTIAENIELDLGGIDMEDEAPMFGAEALFDQTGTNEPELVVADDIESDPAVAIMMQAPDAIIFNAGVIWGQIGGNPDAEQPRNWSGTLSVNRGAIIVRRTIAFEGPTDNLLPRDDKQVVPFTSATLPHVDGLRLTIVDPDPLNSEPLVLHYESAASNYSFTVALGALLDGPVGEVVDSRGNRIAAVAMARPVDICQNGFLRGRWHKVSEGRGMLIGQVRSSDGELKGHMKGLYGVRANGDKVFFGKYINTDGEFRGVFAGNYADGQFRGRWMTKSGEKGALGGEYRETIPGPEVGGHFLGRWAELTCNLGL
jgi:hypothetical protein